MKNKKENDWRKEGQKIGVEVGQK